MKKSFSFLIALTLLCAPALYSDMTVSGSANYSEASAFMDMDIKAPGKLTGFRTKFFALKTAGTTTLTECVMTKEVSVYGGLCTATGTQFNKDILVTGGKLILENCSLPNLTVRGDASIEVELKGSTVIYGSIIFSDDSLNAVITKEPTVEIVGDVINGSFVLED